MRTVSVLALFLGGAGLQAGTSIAVSGRQLIVNCQPMIVRGMNYKPTPYSGGSNWGDDWTLDPAVCSADFAKMEEMGVNTIRVYVEYARLFNNWDNHDPGGDVVVPAELARYQGVLSAARARGIHVIMHYWLPFWADYRSGPNPREWHKTRFKKIINLFKDLNAYPNVLMWAFSNENNFSFNIGALSPAQLFDYYQEAISDAKADADTSHPYTVSLGDNNDINNPGLTSRAPAVDVWGLNIYQYASGYDAVIANYSSSQPLLFTEFGHDVWNVNASATDEATQAGFYQDRWNLRIGPNLSALDASKKVVGGCAFEWNDEWWKDPAGSNSSHDFGGYAGNMENDGILNEEWFGISTALPGGSSGPRTYRQAFQTLKTLWTSGPSSADPPSSCFTPTRSPTPCPACTATFTPTRTPTPNPCLPMLFDDFDDANIINPWGGTWGWAQQSGTATLAAVSPSQSGYGLRWGYSTAAGWSVAYAPLSATADPAGNAGAGTGARDFSAYGRVTFWVKDTQPRSYWLKIASNTNMGNGYNWYRAPFNAGTSWSQVSLDLNAIVFSNPGGNSASFTQNLAAATQFVFEPQSLTPGASVLEMDSLNLVPACGVPTYTHSATRTLTATRSFTSSRTPSPSPSITSTPSSSPTRSPSFTPAPPGSSPTATPTISFTFSASPSRTPSFSPSPTPAPATGVIFEDFETRNLIGAYQYDDGAGSSIAYSVVTTTAKDGSASESISVTTSAGTWGAGHGFASSYANGDGVVDAGGAQYLRVFIKTDKSITLSMSFKEGLVIGGPDPSNEVWEAPAVTVTAGADWQILTLPLSTFTEGIYNPDCQPTCPATGNNLRDLSAIQIVALQFNVNPGTSNAQVFIDNVEFVRVLIPSPTASATASASPTSTSSVPSATATLTPPTTPTFSFSPTPSASPSHTLTASSTATASSTVTATPSPTLSSSPEPSATATPTWTPVPPGSTLTATPTSSPSFSHSPTATPSASPTASSTPTRTATSSSTATPTASITSTASPTGTASPTSMASATPPASPLPTATPSRTATPLLSSTPTFTHEESATSGAINGPLVIQSALALPNPNPHSLSLQLAGWADEVEVKIYSKAMHALLRARLQVRASGRVTLLLPGQAGLPGGVYYFSLVAKRGEIESQAVIGKMLILK